MTAAELKEQIEDLIREAKLETAFILLNKHLVKDADIRQDVLANEQNLSDLNRRFNVGITKNDDYTIERNSITARLLRIIKPLSDEDVVQHTDEEDHKDILIICRNDKDAFYMQAFRHQQPQLKCTIKQLTVYKDPTDYKFIIFDNHSIKDINTKSTLEQDAILHLALMKEYIEAYSEHQKYMIHFGEMTDIVNKNRDIVYAANSKFALFSRIEEMNNYIKSERKFS